MSNQKDDKYKNCFNSQADMWAHLLQGGRIRCMADMKIYELEDGNLHTFYNPNMPGIWEPYDEDAKSKEEKFKAYYSSWWGGAIRLNR